MDPTDHFARKLIDSFAHLEEHLLLEQLAVPEDLSNPDESVELWAASTGTYSAEEEIVVRGHLSSPTAVALKRGAEELAQLFREELLDSEHFRRATTVAGVAGKSADEGGVPSAEEARLN